MGKSAKYGRVGKTKKEREEIQIAKNSQTIVKKPVAAKAITTSTEKKSSAIPLNPSTASSIVLTKKAPPSKASTDKMDIPTKKEKRMAAKRARGHVLAGRVDYVSLMNSRRGAQALLETLEKRG